MDKKLKLKLFKRLGTELGKASCVFLRRAFRIKPTTLGRSKLTAIVKERTGIQSYCLDRIYALINWEIWEQLIYYDWTDKKKYLVDTYDCDDFSRSFCARMSEIYDLNSAGSLHCTVYNALTGNRIAGHLAVLIVTSGGRVFLMESQNDGWLEIKSPSQDLVIKNWRYKLHSVTF